MGSEKPGPEVPQDAFLEKEGSDGKKEGWKVHQKPVLFL